MFTGIITHFGEVHSLNIKKSRDLLLKISTNKREVKRTLEIGCSIACNGICLTLIKKEIIGKKIIFSFEASKETCNKTTLKNWNIGQKINLEFALRMGDEFGGHMVLGHVDSICEIVKIEPIKNSHKFTFLAPKNLLKFISPKCSTTLDGISLTVNDVTKNHFSVNVISHTINNTNLDNSKVGDFVNLEIDVIARYISQLIKKSK
jgi:riboflavin synthase